MSEKLTTIYVSDELPPESLIDCRDWLNAKIAMIPAEFLATATIVFSASTYFDYIEQSVEVRYVRPETDGESRARAAQQASFLADKESAERAKLKKLLKKYGTA